MLTLLLLACADPAAPPAALDSGEDTPATLDSGEDAPLSREGRVLVHLFEWR